MNKRIRKILIIAIMFMVTFIIDSKVYAETIDFPAYTSKPSGAFCDYQLGGMFEHYNQVYLVLDDGEIKYVDSYNNNRLLSGGTNWESKGFTQSINFNSNKLMPYLKDDNGNLKCEELTFYQKDSGRDLVITTSPGIDPNTKYIGIQGILMNGEKVIDDVYIENTCKYDGVAYSTTEKQFNKVAEVEVNYMSDGKLDSKIVLGDQYSVVKYESTVVPDMFKNKNCPDLKVLCEIFPDTSEPGYCQLRTTDIPEIREGKTCTYNGQRSNYKIIVNESKQVKLDDGKTTISQNNGLSTSDVSDLIDSDNGVPDINKCSEYDLFYSKNKKKVLSLKNDSHVEESIKQICHYYPDAEQFCYEGTCNVKNPLCGGNDTSSEDYGNCPSQLEPAIKFIKRAVISTLQIFVPILLILMGTIDMTKAVMSNDEKGLKDATGRLIRRIITAILFFFITTIVSIVVGEIAKHGDVSDANSWKACWNNIE